MKAYPFLKRGADVVVALLLLTLFLPLFIPLMLALRCTGEGEVFYRQERIGYRQRRFRIWKFATMLRDSPNMGSGCLTLRNDPRVTPLGRYLRRSKLNELPQIVNLLTGEMTLVGPRPQTWTEFSAYSPEFQEIISRVKPGITGIGSIIFRDEEALLSVPGRDPRQFYNEHIVPYKGMVEAWYQQRMSVSTDLKILFMTVWVVLRPKSDIYYWFFPELGRLPEELKQAD